MASLWIEEEWTVDCQQGRGEDLPALTGVCMPQGREALENIVKFTVGYGVWIAGQRGRRANDYMYTDWVRL